VIVQLHLTKAEPEATRTSNYTPAETRSIHLKFDDSDSGPGRRTDAVRESSQKFVEFV